MRLRHLVAVTVISLSSSMAFASPTAAGVSGGAKAVGGIAVAGGAAGTIVAVSNLFSNSSKGERLAVTKAPEISTSGTAAGLVLLAGGILIARGRRTQTVSE